MKLLFAQGTPQVVRLVIVLIISVVLMVADHRFQHLDKLRSVLSVVTYPLYALANAPNDIWRWSSTTFRERRGLLADNERLRKENLRIQARLLRLDALKAENNRLRDLLGSSFKIGDRVLIAEIAAIDLNPHKRQIIVNKGTRSGVFEGQPVLDAHGVMGQVLRTTPFQATVLLITDDSHAIPVQVERNGLRTIAVGTGRSRQLELPYLPNNADIRAGDRLITSGLGGKFPPGYPVAIVSRLERTTDQPFSTVLADPAAQLDRTREALLVWTLDDPSKATSNQAPKATPAAARKSTPNAPAKPAAAARPQG